MKSYVPDDDDFFFVVDIFRSRHFILDLWPGKTVFHNIFERPKHNHCHSGSFASQGRETRRKSVWLKKKDMKLQIKSNKMFSG